MKCKNCKNLNRKIEWSPVTYQYPWCYEINDCPDIETERECSKYCGKTNGDKIRRMTDEELAKLLLFAEVTEEIWYYCPDGNRFDCYEDAIRHILNWLQNLTE